MKNRGQSLLLFLVFLPVLIAAGSLFIKNSEFLVVEHRLHGKCEKTLLESLKIQAVAISTIAAINPVATAVIDIKRATIAAMMYGGLNPIVGGPIVKTMQNIQKVVARMQDGITRTANLSTRARAQMPWQEEGSIKRRFSPSLPEGPHGSNESLRLHLAKAPFYQLETGAPQILDSDFHAKQKMEMTVWMNSEHLLSRIFRKPLGSSHRLPSMTMSCAAQIQMETIESPWRVQISRGSQGRLL